MSLVAEYTEAALLIAQSSDVLIVSFRHDALEVSSGGKPAKDPWRHYAGTQRLSTLVREPCRCVRTVGAGPHDLDVNLHDDPLVAND